MGRIFRWTEEFQHFAEEIKESFWGDLYGQTKLAWKGFLEEQSRRERDCYVGVQDYERAGEKRRGYRNGFYVRDFVTRLGQQGYGFNVRRLMRQVGLEAIYPRPRLRGRRGEAAERADDALARALGRVDGLDQEVIGVSLALMRFSGLADVHRTLCTTS
ncbi:MAG: transposase [Acidobacteriota bacterium]|nr:transposase [Acidobacteriota bacterium]